MLNPTCTVMHKSWGSALVTLSNPIFARVIPLAPPVPHGRQLGREEEGVRVGVAAKIIQHDSNLLF
jgi:hypothetical protein